MAHDSVIRGYESFEPFVALGRQAAVPICALVEEGHCSGFDGVALQVAVESRLLAGCSKQRQQPVTDGNEQEQAIAPAFVANVGRAETEPEMQVLRVAKHLFDSESPRVELHDVCGFAFRERRGQAPGYLHALALTSTTAPTCALSAVTNAPMRALLCPLEGTQSAAGCGSPSCSTRMSLRKRTTKSHPSSSRTRYNSCLPKPRSASNVIPALSGSQPPSRSTISHSRAAWRSLSLDFFTVFQAKGIALPCVVIRYSHSVV